ncbi:hypothetical protein M1L60_36000 [Actinoplanes sp. TRM 88003]|uniref:Uncharacterized protein n=1 Tax=Paractinoplanes aksuensis TaxID=2939490 RepID=A0ABT1E1G3_9ACTN|nr:hypothetical protein [Actinoplanes aksuensis]MCO8275995.1 hypothetical protein [Actinoplanes aksuensis]
MSPLRTTMIKRVGDATKPDDFDEATAAPAAGTRSSACCGTGRDRAG